MSKEDTPVTDEQTLAYLSGTFHWAGYHDYRGLAENTLVWAKTEGMAEVERRVREWHEARRTAPGPEYQGTYEENHILYPSGVPRP